jgi:hypothetical protein
VTDPVVRSALALLVDGPLVVTLAVLESIGDVR